MHLFRMVPAAALSAACLLPLSATAQQWIVRCDSPGPKPLCLDATTMAVPGRVQLSECKKGLEGQEWFAKKPGEKQIQNRWLSDGGKNNKGCLDLLVQFPFNLVATKDCDANLVAQQWDFDQTNQNGAVIKNAYVSTECLSGPAIPFGTVQPASCNWAPTWKFVNVGDERLGCPP